MPPKKAKDRKPLSLYGPITNYENVKINYQKISNQDIPLTAKQNNSLIIHFGKILQVNCAEKI